MTIKTWNIEALTGYKPFTTFYEDFSIADNLGIQAIKDTYKLAFNSWKHDHKYITEFIMALNWKIHEHYGTNDAYAKVYDALWREADEWATDNLTGEELQYYYEITD
jgi:hypothetical protein